MHLIRTTNHSGMNKCLSLLLFVGMALVACVPPEAHLPTDVRIDFTEPLQRHVYDLQDRQLSDSLYRYFHHPDPTIRYLAAQAFASIKDTAAVDSLAALLHDPVTEVRAVAAYAMGQTGNPRATPLLIAAFDRFDTAGVHALSNAAILEAVGKTGGERELELLATISTYRPTDTLLLLGQAWGIYRFALRQITHRKGTECMLRLLSDTHMPADVRMVAANYLYRARNQLEFTDDDLKILVQHFVEDADPRIRMALAPAIGQRPDSEVAWMALSGRWLQETDWRVRCNILRALEGFDYTQVRPLVEQALRDSSHHVAQCAAQYLLAHGQPWHGSRYLRLAADTALPWQVQTTLLRAANRHISPAIKDQHDYANFLLRSRFQQAVNPYEKAACLEGLAEFPWNYRFIWREAHTHEAPVVRTSCVAALRQIATIEAPRRYFGLSFRRVRAELSSYFASAIRSGDVGMAAEAAQALMQADPDMNFKVLWADSTGVVDEGLQKLQLPRDIETWNVLQRLKAWLQGQPAPPPARPEYNHPIDWELVPAAPTRVTLGTNKGDIVLELLPTLAPGTVASFRQLVRDGYYNGKTFHRVVPNFVIQGGCPRGDGYGSLDFSLRSELPWVHYDRAGYVGMASAGNHTEGVQFFITHSPTPHLDGNYTIFARVVQGQNVVDAIAVGDRIERVVVQQ